MVLGFGIGFGLLAVIGAAVAAWFFCAGKNKPTDEDDAKDSLQDVDIHIPTVYIFKFVLFFKINKIFYSIFKEQSWLCGKEKWISKL